MHASSCPPSSTAGTWGANVDTTAARRAPALTRRIRKATRTAAAALALPTDSGNKAKLVAGKVLLQALYGCEVGAASTAALDKLTTVILDCMSGRNRLRSANLAFEAAGQKDRGAQTGVNSGEAKRKRKESTPGDRQ